MATNFDIHIKTDLDSILETLNIETPLQVGDKNAHTIYVDMYRSVEGDVQAVGNVWGYFQTEYKTEPYAVSGDIIDGHIAAVSIPADAYAEEGKVVAIVRMVDSNNTSTVAKLAFSVVEDVEQSGAIHVGKEWTVAEIQDKIDFLINAVDNFDDTVKAFRDEIAKHMAMTNGSAGLRDIESAGILGATNRWTSLSNSGHCVLSVKAGDIVDITVPSSDSINQNYGILRSYGAVVNNTLADMSTDPNFANRMALTKGSSVTFTAPTDAKFLYLQVYYTTNVSHSVVKINGVRQDYNVRVMTDKIAKVGSGVIFTAQPALVNNTDLNTVISTGHYNLGSSLTFPNAPTASGYRELSVYEDPSTGVVKQTFIDVRGNIYVRVRNMAGEWFDWNCKTASMENVMFASKRTINNGEDLNDIKEMGYYNLSSGGSFVNSPIGSTGYNSLAVFTQENSAIIKQIFHNYRYGTEYYRWYANGAWSDWQDNTDVIGFKMVLGHNPARKALDHGGFWNGTYAENSPMAFIRSAKQGIIYHNVDITFSSDGVPFAWHDNNTSDVNGVAFKMNETTADVIKSKTMGNADYSFHLMTLAELDGFIKKLGGCIEMVDVTAGDNDTMSLRNAQNLPAYYRSHNIKPTYTNWDKAVNRNAFIEAGPEYGVYLVVDSVNINDALTYINNHSNTRFAVNFAYGSAHRDAIESNYGRYAAIGVTLYAGVFSYSDMQSGKVPMWADGILSENYNVNFYDWYNNGV